MPNTEEYERLKEALKRPPTPEAMKEAAKRFSEYEEAAKVRLARRKPKGYNPYLVSLGFQKPYPPQIPLDKVPQELERNPELYKLLSRIVAKETKK